MAMAALSTVPPSHVPSDARQPTSKCFFKVFWLRAFLHLGRVLCPCITGWKSWGITSLGAAQPVIGRNRCINAPAPSSLGAYEPKAQVPRRLLDPQRDEAGSAGDLTVSAHCTGFLPFPAHFSTPLPEFSRTSSSLSYVHTSPRLRSGLCRGTQVNGGIISVWI